jgi:hypothetical protein
MNAISTQEQESTKLMNTRNFTFAASALALGLATLVAPSRIQAQPLWDRVDVNLPYTVSIGDKTLQPGNYVIQQLDSPTGNSQVLLIYSDNGMKFQTSALTIPALQNRTQPDTRVILHHIGNDYYFDKVWIQGKDYGYEFPLPNSVKMREREAMAPVSVAATASSVPANQATTQAATTSRSTTQQATTNQQTSTAANNQRTTTATNNQQSTMGAANNQQTSTATNNQRTTTATNNQRTTTATNNQQSTMGAANNQQTSAATNNQRTTTATNNQQSTMGAANNQMSSSQSNNGMNSNNNMADNNSANRKMPRTSAGWLMMLLSGGALSGLGAKLRGRK